MTRPQTWTVEEQRDGTFTVQRGNRPVATGLNDQRHAKEIIRGARKAGEKVWHVAEDGYRTDLTRQFPDPEQLPEKNLPQKAPVSTDHPVRARYLMRYRRA